MFTLIRFIAAAGSLYMLALTVRVILTWFPAPQLGEPYRLLCKATDPYLDWFKRFPALRAGAVDFSPVAGIAALALFTNVLATLGQTGRIGIGVILALVLRGVWGVAGFLLFFLSAALVAYIAFRPSGGRLPAPVHHALDAIVRPVIAQTNRLIFRDRLVHYRTGAITALAILVGVNIGGGLLVGIVSGLLGALPF